MAWFFMHPADLSHAQTSTFTAIRRPEPSPTRHRSGKRGFKNASRCRRSRARANERVVMAIRSTRSSINSLMRIAVTHRNRRTPHAEIVTTRVRGMLRASVRRYRSIEHAICARRSIRPKRATLRSVWSASSARQLVDRPDGDTVRRPVPRRPWERRYPCCFLDSATDFLVLFSAMGTPACKGCGAYRVPGSSPRQEHAFGTHKRSSRQENGPFHE